MRQVQPLLQLHHLARQPLRAKGGFKYSCFQGFIVTPETLG